MSIRPKTVSVFGSSRPSPGDAQYLAAHELGRELAAAGFSVCNGGYGGIMEASALGAKSVLRSTPEGKDVHGGHTIGVICADFRGKKANRWIDEVIIMQTLMERMMKLIALGDAYVVLPGGTGTLLEFAATWELMNKGLEKVKPLVLLGDFWRPILDTLREELAWEGLDRCTKYVSLAATPNEAVRIILETLKGAEHEQ
jgi:uncharacterized protein (TIGR00730 family)